MTRRLDEFEQIFDLCLDQVQSGQKSLDSVLAQYPGQAAELRPRLEAALWLDGRKGSLDPRPGFIAASRESLVAQLKSEVKSNPVTVQPPKESLLLFWWRQFTSQSTVSGRRLAFQLALIIVFLFTTVTGGRQVALAAQDAIPGDPLYPVKITLERVEMIATQDLAEEIRLHAEFAHNRLIEAQGLVLEGRYEYIPGTLARFGAHVNNAVSKLETLARRDAGLALVMTAYLHQSLSEQLGVLDTLMGVVPLAMQPEITKALDITGGAIIVVEEIDVQTGGRSLNTPVPISPTEEVSTFGSQTGTPSATVTPSPSSTFTLVPSETPTPFASATLTPGASSTPAPGITRTPDSGDGGDIDPDPTKPPTEKPPPTDEPPPPTDEPPPPTEEPKPTNTKKPMPSPTRRPPQPTKESKPTQEIEPTQTGN